jgi:hypothetical protein
MGLLDDAIREHLELKRRRGADPEEIARQEREALGPVRRTAAPEAGDEPAAAAARERGAEPAPRSEEAPGASVAEAGRDPRAGADAGASREAPEEPVPGHGVDVDVRGTDRGVEPGAAADEGRDPRAAAAPADEDVLEGTPDFLQETPEHDRLWFEQRPPRDFEF